MAIYNIINTEKKKLCYKSFAYAELKFLVINFF